MNELDHFVKHELRVKHYARYTDDFVIVSEDGAYLENLVSKISTFMRTRLALSLHPGKVSVRKYKQGADFLGYIALPRHILVRQKTGKRIFRKLHARVMDFRAKNITEKALLGTLNSYLGVLSHANAHKLTEKLKNQFWFWLNE